LCGSLEALAPAAKAEKHSSPLPEPLPEAPAPAAEAVKRSNPLPEAEAVEHSNPLPAAPAPAAETAELPKNRRWCDMNLDSGDDSTACKQEMPPQPGSRRRTSKRAKPSARRRRSLRRRQHSIGPEDEFRSSESLWHADGPWGVRAPRCEPMPEASDEVWQTRIRGDRWRPYVCCDEFHEK